MFYPKADCCPYNNNIQSDKASADLNLPDEKNSELCLENSCNVSEKCEMMRKIQEIDFAIIDLNLFLDTHPQCKEAITLFKELSATSKSLKNDYQARYGPLYVYNSSNPDYFEWVEKCGKWPWEKGYC